MRLPFVSRRRYETLVADYSALHADHANVSGERDRRADELAAVSIVNARLTEDLTKAREQLAASMDAESALARQIHEMAQPVEPTDSEMDEINRLHRELAAEKKRADRLQKQLDDAFSLDHPTVAAGATWQDRRELKMRYDA